AVLVPTLLRGAFAGDAFTVDTVHSSVIYRIKHMNVGYAYGRFNDITGSFTVDEQNPSGMSFQVQVKPASVDTGNPKRDQHLKSPDFFNAQQFPVITFKSKKVTKSGTGYDVEGDLTLHGTTKPVMAKVEGVSVVPGFRGGYQAGLEATLEIKRSDFGMSNM